MMTKGYAYALVMVQFACLCAFALLGPIIARNIFLLLLELGGIGIGLYSIRSARWGRFRITPLNHDHGILVTSGPYRFIRHPMYLATLLTTLSLLPDPLIKARLALWTILLIVLNLKLRLEEKLLMQKWPEYAQYRRRSKRLLPFIY